MVEHIHEETAFGWAVWGTCAIPRLWGDTRRGRTERVLESPSETAWAVALGSSCPLCAELALTLGWFCPLYLEAVWPTWQDPWTRTCGRAVLPGALGLGAGVVCRLCSTAVTLVFKLQVGELPGRRGSLANGGGSDCSPLHSLPSSLTSG